MKVEFEVVDGKANLTVKELDYKALALNPDGAQLLGEGLHMFQALAQRFLQAQQAAAEAAKGADDE